MAVAIAPYADAHPWLLSFMPIWLGGLTIALVLIARSSRNYAIKLGLVCPHCKNVLANSKALVIASKHCGQCGNRVLDDD